MTFSLKTTLPLKEKIMTPFDIFDRIFNIKVEKNLELDANNLSEYVLKYFKMTKDDTIFVDRIVFKKMLSNKDTYVVCYFRGKGKELTTAVSFNEMKREPFYISKMGLDILKIFKCAERETCKKDSIWNFLYTCLVMEDKKSLTDHELYVYMEADYSKSIVEKDNKLFFRRNENDELEIHHTDIDFAYFVVVKFEGFCAVVLERKGSKKRFTYSDHGIIDDDKKETVINFFMEFLKEVK